MILMLRGRRRRKRAGGELSGRIAPLRGFASWFSVRGIGEKLHGRNELNFKQVSNILDRIAVFHPKSVLFESGISFKAFLPQSQ